jgi:TonB family protein
VQTRISEELRKNPRTRKANTRIEVRIWVDPATGRLIRAKLGSSTGEAGLDQAIIETLQGTQLQQPPPEGMPMPIVLRVTARRPN